MPDSREQGRQIVLTLLGRIDALTKNTELLAQANTELAQRNSAILSAVQTQNDLLRAQFDSQRVQIENIQADVTMLTQAFVGQNELSQEDYFEAQARQGLRGVATRVAQQVVRGFAGPPPLSQFPTPAPTPWFQPPIPRHPPRAY